MSKRSVLGPALLLGGGAAAAAASLFAWRKSVQTTDAIKEAVAQPPLPGAPTSSLPTFQARLTGYYPYVAGLTAKERLMEGAPIEAAGYAARAGRKAGPLHTLEMHKADRTAHPFVSVSCDLTIFPFGQRLIIDAWPDLIFRCVDTGGHFTGAGKLVRIIGREPLDICVDSSKTVVPKLADVKIVPGDSFEASAVAYSKFKDQVVVGGLVEARITDDHDALARAVESNFGGRQRDEAVAAAWAIRNRADEEQKSVQELLAPAGEYGSPHATGGFASTRKVSTEWSRQIAEQVLDALSVSDPTGGAVDYWIPDQQDEMYQLGDVYRAAAQSGDDVRAGKYERYGDYGTEGDVRVQFAREGFEPARTVGAVELLTRKG